MNCLLSNMCSRCRSGRVCGLEVAFYTSLTGFAAFKRHDPHGESMQQKSSGSSEKLIWALLLAGVLPPFVPSA
jgi:hypothetical protein